jgi:hypothetical protein
MLELKLVQDSGVRADTLPGGIAFFSLTPYMLLHLGDTERDIG